MNLDEAIQHCEEVAEAEEQKLKDWKGDYSHLQIIDSCKECAEEHRQLAEWLKDYKRLLENQPRWIPVEESLPQLNKYNQGPVWKRKVLVTAHYNFGYKDSFVATEYAENIIENYKDINGEYVTAWMSLPKPYQGGKSE